MVSNAKGVGGDGQSRVHRGTGGEEAAVDDVEIVHFVGADDLDDPPSPESFRPPDDPRWPGHWAHQPEPWADDRLADAEAAQRVRAEIDRLPPNQRQVIILRDIEDWDSAEVCEALGISEANQRVLLHRARTRVRKALACWAGRAEP
jgi:RNA polymerase sigma-70 factor, ECF subfamily